MLQTTSRMICTKCEYQTFIMCNNAVHIVLFLGYFHYSTRFSCSNKGINLPMIKDITVTNERKKDNSITKAANKDTKCCFVIFPSGKNTCPCERDNDTTSSARFLYPSLTNPSIKYILFAWIAFVVHLTSR
jgi:hypothetical protein